MLYKLAAKMTKKKLKNTLTKLRVAFQFMQYPLESYVNTELTQELSEFA